MKMNGNQMQHLEFIQNTITRMNTNSFQLKEFTVLTITACLAIYASEKILLMFLVPILPTIMFWFLDSYYLLQEKRFRELYNEVAQLKKQGKRDIKLYEMDTTNNTTDNKNPTFLKAFFSITLRNFYGSLIVILVLLYYFNSPTF